MNNDYYEDEYELEEEIVLAPSTPSGKSGTLSPNGRKFAMAIGILAIAASIAYFAWLAFANPTVRGKDVGFKIVNSELTQFTFDVAKPEDRTVICAIDALNQAYAQVGTRDVVVGPADVFEQRFTVDIRTSEMPVSATVVSCTLTEDQ